MEIFGEVAIMEVTAFPENCPLARGDGRGSRVRKIDHYRKVVGEKVGNKLCRCGEMC